MASKVYFVNAKCRAPGESLEVKGGAIFDSAGLGDCIEKGDRVAVKLHMGDRENTGFLRPNLVRVIVDKIKEYGGEPFLTDTTTLPYTPWGGRTTAFDYAQTYISHGYTPASVGCPIIVADGIYGLDDIEVDVPEGFQLRKTFVARAIATADAMIVVSHFKGHAAGGMGGAIKNLGVGCMSKRGKYLVHCADWAKPAFDPKLCPGKKCEIADLCENCCPEKAIKVLDKTMKLDEEKCRYCWSCITVCGVLGPNAISTPKGLRDNQNERMAENALAVMKCFDKGKVGFLHYAIDITPECDCVNYTDSPIVNNIGVYGSKDPIAIDKSCLDVMMRMEGNPYSIAQEKNLMEPGTERFYALHKIDPLIQLDHGAKIGLGSKDYELVEMPLDPKKFVPRRLRTIEVLRKLYERQHPYKEIEPRLNTILKTKGRIR